MGADNSSPGQDEAYNFYGGIAQQLGQYFGASTSGQYQGSRPGDFSSLAARDQGSRGFSSTMGIQTQNPLLNIFGGMALQSALGKDLQNVRPFGQPNISAQDFIEGRQRSMQSQAMAKDILQLNAPYYSSRIGNAGNNMGAQMMLDALNPAGSQVQAFNQIYANQGRAFGSTEQQKSEGAFNTVLQMSEAFAQESGPNKGGWDFRKSYGFDYNQTAEGGEVAIRRGIGKGMTNENFAAAVNRGEGGDMLRENNRVFQAAGDLFGRDKTMDQLGESINDILEGANQLDSSQVTEALQKIKATARAVDMSGEAFSEYSKLLTDMYRSVGITGPAVTGNVLSSIKSARIATEIGRETGDATMGDYTKNLEASGLNKMRLEKSQGMKEIKAVAAIASKMTDEQMASVQVKGMGSMAQVMQTYKKALDEGDTDTLSNIATAVNMSGNEFFKAGKVTGMAREWGADDDAAANKTYDFSKVGDLQGGKFRKFVAKGIAGNIDKNIMAKIGQQGFDKIMDEVSSPAEAQDRARISAIIKGKFGGMGLNQQEQDKLATQFAINAEERFDQYKQYGYENKTQSGMAFASGSRVGREKAAKMSGQIETSQKQAKYLAEISGDVMRPFGEKEAMKEALNVAMELQNGTIDGKSVMGKDGKWDLGKFTDLVKARTKGVLKLSETKDMMAAAKALSSPEAISEVEKAGEDAASQAATNGAGPQEVEKIRDEARRNKVNDLYNKSLEGAPGGKPDGQSDEEEKQERDDAIKKSNDIEKDGDGSSGAPGRGKVGPGPNDVLGDSGKSSEKVDTLVTEAQKQTGLLETIAEKLPDSNKIASVSKPNSAPSKATTLGGGP